MKIPASVIILFYLIVLTGVSLSDCSSHQQPAAFPGAEGFGRFASGGRFGRVFRVTNLNDYGPGSLREAVDARGKRTVVFSVSGTIILEKPLHILHDDITIAGQTASGDGICIRNCPVLVAADNVIIRYVRIRLGDESRIADDAICGMHHNNIIIDHCSLSWGMDEVASFYDNENFTMQWCIISESLNHSYHAKGEHGYGGIWGGMKATFHHNVLAHHSSRTPRFNGSRTHGRPDRELVDFRNNVIYNWGMNSSYGGEGGQYNIVANYYKAGPATRSGLPKFRIVEPWDGKGRWFVSENYVFGFTAVTRDNWSGGVQSKYNSRIKVNLPFPCENVTTQTAEQAFVLVLEQAGAVLPKRDVIDLRIVEEIKTGTALHGSGIIDSQTMVGGWPELFTRDVPQDSDSDGMPDDWETRNNLDPQNAADQNQDSNSDGYTNLEEYLNWLTLPAQSIQTIPDQEN